MLVYAKGRRIITPPHMCTHENTIMYKRSCFKLPKTASLKTLLIELPLCNVCVGVWIYFFMIPGSLGEVGDYFITHP